MKKTILILFLLIPFIGIAQSSKGYFYTLMTEPKSCSENDLIYVDSIIKVNFSISYYYVSVSITNVANSTLSVLWDESAIAINGFVDKTAIVGQKITVGMPESKILKNTSLFNTRLTQKSIHRRGNKVRDLFNRKYIKKIEGVPILLTLPIEINGIKKEYEFSFVFWEKYYYNKNIEKIL